MNFRARFSLRTLAILLTLICILIGVPIGYIRYKAERQRQVIARLKELNVAVGLHSDAKPSWVINQLRQWVDKDALLKVATVNIRENSQEVDEIIELLLEFNSLSEIICGRVSLDDRHLQQIATISSLTHLGVEEGTCTHETTKKLLKNRNWELLSLPKVPFNDELIGELGKQRNLLRVTFDASEASSKGLEQIAACQTLSDVYLLRIQHADGFARAIRRLPTVQVAILMQSKIDANSLAEFADVGSLRSLHFYECQVDSAKIAQLSNAQSLTHLEFFKSPISADAVAAVSKLTKMQVLALDSCLDDSNVGNLGSLSSLKILALSRTALTDNGLQQLAKIRTLRLVVLPEDTKCSEAGIRRLQEKAAIRVVVGMNLSEGMLYLPGGKTEDRRKSKKP